MKKERSFRRPRKFPIFNLLIFLIAAIGLFKPGFSAARENRKNLLLITLDTLRTDRLGCYGYSAIETPTIDELAKKGVLFQRAFAHAPSTLPSHTSILLGLAPPAHGVHDNSGFIVRPEFLTLAEWLKAQGYATAAFIGAFPLDSRFGLNQGFDVYDDRYGSQGSDMLAFAERKAEQVVERALEWLRNPSRTEPWFLWIHLFDPHQPWMSPEPFKTHYAEAPYDGEVAYTDHALAELIEDFKRRGLDRRTLIILTGDHGESLGDHGEMTHGYFAYNATLWAPLIMAGPALEPSVITSNVSHVDIFPTACDLLDIKKPKGLQGASLLPLIKGRKTHDRPIYFEALNAYYNRGWAPLRGYLEGKNKFIDLPIPEYYDLEKDFFETKNLARDRDLNLFRSRLSQIREKLATRNSDRLAASSMDRGTLAKLRSLGYLASPQPARERLFTAEEDLKTLLPFNQKWMRAMVLRGSGHADEGITLLQEIIDERKDFDLAYIYLANFFKEQSRFEDAMKVLRQGYDHNPESFTILTNYGITLVESSRFDEAIGLLQKAAGIIDYDPDVWNNLGVAYWNKGAFEEAMNAYERAIALDVNDAIIITNIGSLHLSISLKNRSEESLAKSVDAFRKVISMDPAYAPAYNGLGAALKILGDVDGAIEAWAKAVELKPRFSLPLYNLGQALLERGEKAKALGYFTRYRELNEQILSPEEKQILDAYIESCQH